MREGSVYEIEGERELIFRIYTDRLPKTVLLDGVKAKKGKVWTADRKTGVCEFRLIDDGMKHIIKFAF